MKAKTEGERAERTDRQRSDAEAQKAQTTRLQQGVASMRSGAANFLAVADSKTDQSAADGYAQQIVSQIFGGAVPIETASTLFNDYHKLKTGTSDPTQGSTAFLRALGLAS
jgi:hypothetical protein